MGAIFFALQERRAPRILSARCMDRPCPGWPADRGDTSSLALVVCRVYFRVFLRHAVTLLETIYGSVVLR